MSSKLSGLIPDQKATASVASPQIPSSSASVTSGGAPLAPPPAGMPALPLERMQSVPTIATRPTAHRRALSVSGNGGKKTSKCSCYFLDE